MKTRRGYNPKRKIASPDAASPNERETLSRTATYAGNPDHKRSPADYGLTPGARPRPGKTLCDGDRIILKAEATDLLKAGLLRGTFSCRRSQGWPQNVWSVSASGEVFEAQLENAASGAYHGYPMPEDDDFRAFVKEEWAKRG